MLLGVIIACEIGFWVFLVAGLGARYLLRRRRTGAALLVGTVLVNIPLLIATVADLRGGATANVVHGLAAAYLGYTIAFGHSMVRWADERFAHRFAGGPPPRGKPKYGRERARYERREFAKAALAWAVSCGLLLGAIVLVGDAERTQALRGWIYQLTVVLAIWSIWPITHTLWPAKPKPGEAPADQVGSTEPEPPRR